MSAMSSNTAVASATTQRIVITGGPGSGKSTLLRALAEAGEVCYEEVSRLLIREQKIVGGDLLPWMNLAGFAKECVTRMRMQLSDSVRHRRAFFDRGLPDVIGYLRHGGLMAPRELYAASVAYSPIVFFAPPWPEIYVNDTERPQSYAEAVALSAQIRTAYADCGLQLVELVRGSIRDRLRQVRQHVQIEACA
jgi:predicted ATPase